VPASHWQDASGTERESEPLSGNFSLVFRKLDGRWVIVHDHTSRGDGVKAGGSGEEARAAPRH